MSLATIKIARDRLLLRRARQRAAAMAREKEWRGTTPRSAVTSHLAVPAAFRQYNDAAVRRLLVLGQRRGYLTYGEVNTVLPKSEIWSEEIEHIVSAIYDLGIELTEGEDGTRQR